MAKMNSLEAVLVDELRDLMDAERQLTRALPKMARAADAEELRTAFEDHLEETRNHVDRLTDRAGEAGRHGQHDVRAVRVEPEGPAPGRAGGGAHGAAGAVDRVHGRARPGRSGEFGRGAVVLHPAARKAVAVRTSDRDARVVDRFWDVLVAGSSADGSVSEGLDPSLADLVRRLHAADPARAPRPSFLYRMRQTLLASPASAASPSATARSSASALRIRGMRPPCSSGPHSASCS